MRARPAITYNSQHPKEVGSSRTTPASSIRSKQTASSRVISRWFVCVQFHLLQSPLGFSSDTWTAFTWIGTCQQSPTVSLQDIPSSTKQVRRPHYLKPSQGANRELIRQDSFCCAVSAVVLSYMRLVTFARSRSCLGLAHFLYALSVRPRVTTCSRFLFFSLL